MNKEWITVIKPEHSLFELKVGDLFRYKDLFWIFVKRDIVTLYKQTVLGPLWYIIQPIVMALLFSLVFGRLARIPTDAVSPLLFYLSGITLWGYLADCFTKTSNTFIDNQHIFGKVYFPRVLVPLSSATASLLKLSLQLLLFTMLWLPEVISGGITPQWSSFYILPVSMIIVVALAVGGGMMVSAVTTKYRDLIHLLSFGLQLWMYSTPIIYPSSVIPASYLKWLAINPMLHVMEGWRFALFGKGQFMAENLIYSVVFSAVVFSIGYLMFSRSEKNFMDTV